MTPPHVSVLLPCRNEAAHVSEAVASILGQSYGDLELIAVDDASVDATSALLSSWARRDERVRLVRGSGRGIVAALEAGLAEARGELIARMDADDIADPQRLALQVAALERDPLLAGCGTGVRYFPREQVRDGALRYEQWLNALRTPAELRRDRFVECPIAHPTLLLRRRVLDDVGGYRDPGWPEDYDLVLRLLAAGHELCNLPDVLLHWRDRPDRLSRTEPRYAEVAFRRCKLHYLRPLLHARDGVVVWGAGPVGKGFARLLQADGFTVRAFVDLDPRKLGQTVHGAPVVPPARIDDYRGAFGLAAVAGPVARAEIRRSLADAGWQEGADYVAVA